ncbi:MAG: bifunctional (p)ppGpp synthetase/guanosine-3',5'-bis(diphosphate) 3'-pyrophosphohydrolase [Nannocystaceae bacterium]|nr:bifunctional (p)ppGpp synthetase/guanosine-3',5'-bis(diphosphate) 3'-pyrophosphohydrolase [Nannocystaceae bacterium]
MHAPALEAPLAAFRTAAAYLGDLAAVERAIGLVEREAPGRDAALARGLAIATTLAELGLDAAALQASLLRPGCEEGLPLARVEEVAGSEVARLVGGVQRLEHIRWDHLEQEASENLRKMFLAIASDIRVVLIALAERLHVLRGLDARPEAERRGLARETMEVYAPLANRLGIWQMKWELEDLAFRALSPDIYREIKRLLADKRTARTAAIDEVIALLQSKLREAGIAGRVSGRPKHIYSIYKKMQRKRLGYEHIYDVSAVRVIVDRLEDCYAVLGMVHGQWTPIAGEFDDYIAKPKGNDYRSLHTAVVGPDGKPLEVQIRTQQMHDYNEYGVAAHWRYKEGASRADKRFDAKINLLRQLMAWQREVTVAPGEGAAEGGEPELAHAMRTEIFADQVYVFTPTGDVVDLPQGATPVDFAYRIHTDVGHRCRGAKVNGQIVGLDHQLQTGDRVEIITAKQAKPSRDWLNPQLGYVHTASARQKIKVFFRQQQRDSAIAQGREIVERELKRLGLEARGVESIVPFYPKYAELGDLLAAIGFGDIVPQSISTRLLEWLELERAAQQPLAVTASPESSSNKGAAQVSIGGVDDVMSHPARCCNPVPGDDVVGYITRGRGLAIHRVDCSNARTEQEPERWMPLSWGARRGQSYPVGLQIVAEDRAGLLRDIAEIVAQEGVNIANTSAVKSAREQSSIITLQLEIRSSEQVVRIMGRLERMPGTRSVRRVAA